MAKRPLPLAEVYRLIEPGPVVLVSTMSGGRANIMTMSWHMMVDFEPPIIACVMSNRDYSFTRWMPLVFGSCAGSRNTEGSPILKGDWEFALKAPQMPPSCSNGTYSLWLSAALPVG